MKRGQGCAADITEGRVCFFLHYFDPPRPIQWSFGKFTCRVLVYRDQYAGTWSGGDHGGHLFGRVVKEKKDVK